MGTVADLTAILRLKDEMSPSLSSAMKNLTSNIAGMLSFGAAVKEVTSALEAQGEQEAQITKLNLALANQGTYSKATSDALVEYSSSLMLVSTFADEVILGAETMFVRFGLNTEQTKRATQAALDLASATGQDLQSAVLAIEKGIQGHTKGLAQFNVTVDSSASETERFGQVMAQLESRLGGSALAATQTYAGQMKMLSNQMNEVQEGVGKFVGSLMDIQGGTNVGITALQKMSFFFGNTMVVVVAEARGAILDFFADLAHQAANLADWLSQHPFLSKALGVDPKVAAESKAFFSEYSKQLHDQADAVRLAGDQAAVSAGKVQTFANNTHVASGFQKDAAENAHKLAMELYEAKKAAEEYVIWLDQMNEKSGFVVVMSKQLKEEDAAQISQKVPLIEAIRQQVMETVNATTQEASHKRVVEDVVAQMVKHKQITQEQADAYLKGAKALEQYTGWMKTLNDIFGKAIAITDSLSHAFDEMGIDANKGIGEAVKGLDNLAHAGSDAVKSFAAFGSGNILGGITAGLSAIGGIVSGVKKVWDGLFGNPEIQQVNKMRDSFFQSQGGFEAFSQKMAAVSKEDWAKKIFDAKTVADFNSLVAQATGLLTTQEDATKALDDAAQRYGLTVEQMGPAMQRQKLDEQAGQLIQDWKLLTASGVDVNVVMSKMGPNMSDFVNTSIRAGQAIPEAMKPMLEQMAKSGQLLDANGNAFTQAQVDGMNFSQTMTEQFQTLIEKIDAMVSALTGIGGVKVPPVHVPIVYDDPGAPDGGGHGPEHHAAAGFNGMVFGPTRFLTGEAGPEHVQITPGGAPSGGAGDATAAAIARLSAQLAQQLHPQELARAFKSAGQLG